MNPSIRNRTSAADPHKGFVAVAGVGLGIGVASLAGIVVSVERGGFVAEGVSVGSPTNNVGVENSGVAVNQR